MFLSKYSVFVLLYALIFSQSEGDRVRTAAFVYLSSNEKLKRNLRLPFFKHHTPHSTNHNFNLSITRINDFYNAKSRNFKKI